MWPIVDASFVHVCLSRVQANTTRWDLFMTRQKIKLNWSNQNEGFTKENDGTCGFDKPIAGCGMLCIALKLCVYVYIYIYIYRYRYIAYTYILVGLRETSLGALGELDNFSVDGLREVGCGHTGLSLSPSRWKMPCPPPKWTRMRSWSSRSAKLPERQALDVAGETTNHTTPRTVDMMWCVERSFLVSVCTMEQIVVFEFEPANTILHGSCVQAAGVGMISLPTIWAATKT